MANWMVVIDCRTADFGMLLKDITSGIATAAIGGGELSIKTTPAVINFRPYAKAKVQN